MKVLKWKMNEKIVAICAVVFFIVLCLVPLLMIARYDHPCADDYGYGYEAHVAWRTTHSLAEVFKAAINTVKTTYYTWQGTFVSIFLMALTPAVFGEQYYMFVPYLMLGILTVSIGYLSKVLLHDLLKASYANCIIISVITLFMMIEGIYTPASAFFWYNAAIHYTFMQAVMFLMLAFVLRSLTTQNRIIRVVTCILAGFCGFCVAGGNYLNALLGIVILGSVFIGVIIYLFIKRKNDDLTGKKKAILVICALMPLVIYAVAFIINVSAPGNAIRGNNFPDVSAIASILRSFVSGGKYLWKWMSPFTFCLMILALPAIFAALKKTQYRFQYPLLVLIFSFCLFSASFTSSYYGMGGEGLPRTFNNGKMLYHLLLLVNEVYWLGWLQRLWREKKKKQINVSHGIVFYAVVIVALAGVFLLCDDKEAYYPSYASAKYMYQGFAEHYHHQYLQRLSIVNGPEKTIYLNEIEPKLNVLYVDDITTNPSDWRNQQYARWYGKEAVILIPTSQ